MLLAFHLRKRCDKLYESALLRAESLKPLRKVFAEQKSEEIQLFSSKVYTYSYYSAWREFVYISISSR